MDCFFPFYLRGNHPTNITISSHNQTSINGEKDIIPFTAITITYLFSTIANFSLIFGLKKTNTKLTISQKLYIYLSFTDAFFSLIMFVMVLLEFLPDQILADGGFTIEIELAERGAFLKIPAFI